MNRFRQLVLALVAAFALAIGALYLASSSPVHADAVLSFFTNPDGSACSQD